MSRELFDPYTATPSNPKTQYEGQVIRRKKVNLAPGCFKKSDVETAVLIMKSFGYWPYLYRPLVYPHYSTWSRSFEVSITNASDVEYTLNDFTAQVSAFAHPARFNLPNNDPDHYRIYVNIHCTRFLYQYFMHSQDQSINSTVQSVVTGLLMPNNDPTFARTIFNGALPGTVNGYLITIAPTAANDNLSFRYSAPGSGSIQHVSHLTSKSIGHTSFYTFSADRLQAIEIAECLNNNVPYPDDDPQNYSLFQFALNLTNTTLNSVYTSLQFIFEIIVASYEGDTVYQFPQ